MNLYFVDFPTIFVAVRRSSRAYATLVPVLGRIGRLVVDWPWYRAPHFSALPWAPHSGSHACRLRMWQPRLPWTSLPWRVWNLVYSNLQNASVRRAKLHIDMICLFLFSLICPDAESQRTYWSTIPVNIWSIMSKVRSEAFLWGAGNWIVLPWWTFWPLWWPWPPTTVMNVFFFP